MSSSETRVDVRDLQSEALPTAEFPATLQADFRLFMAPEVHRGVQQHAGEDASVEICGILVGHWQRDADGPFARVTNYIRCDSASSKFAEVTFTHESWAQINAEMDSKYADARIVGWYHSHPDFGVFLSERDVFIHENFFSGAGQVAYVVDPVRDAEGVFVWRSGKPEPLGRYYVGEEIYTAAAIRGRLATDLAPPPDARPPTPAPSPMSWLDSTLGMTVAALGLLLLGYLYGGWRTRWEQRMIAEGAVAHYGVNKVMKLGLKEEMAELQRLLRAIGKEYGKTPDVGAELDEQQIAEAEKQRRVLADNLQLAELVVAKIAERYGLSDDERDALARLVAVKQGELNRPPPAEPPAEDAPQAEDAPPAEDVIPTEEAAPAKPQAEASAVPAPPTPDR